jgi:hypothetical protein
MFAPYSPQEPHNQQEPPSAEAQAYAAWQAAKREWETNFLFLFRGDNKIDADEARLLDVFLQALLAAHYAWLLTWLYVSREDWDDAHSARIQEWNAEKDRYISYRDMYWPIPWRLPPMAEPPPISSAPPAPPLKPTPATSPATSPPTTPSSTPGATGGVGHGPVYPKPFPTPPMDPTAPWPAGPEDPHAGTPGAGHPNPFPPAKTDSGSEPEDYFPTLPPESPDRR